jgi:hypothetical protein
LLNSQTENTSLKNELAEVRARLNKIENTTMIDVNDLNKIIGEQKNEIGDLRRKLNLSLDHKRKLEQEVDNL